MIGKSKTTRISFASIAVLAILFLFASPSAFAASPSLGSSSSSSSSATSSPTVTGCGTPCIYVGDYASGQLSVINASTLKVFETIALPSGSANGVFGVNYVAKTKTIWVSDFNLGEILVFSAKTNKVIKTISIVAPAFMTLAPNGLMFVAQFGHSSYQAVNTSDYSLGASITACGTSPEFLDYNSKDGKIYAPARSACYDIINPKTDAVTHVTLGTAPTGVAVNQKTGLTYITDSTTNQTYVVKGSKLVKTITSSEFKNGRLWGAFYSPMTNDVYIVASGQAVGGVYPIGKVIPINSTNAVLPAIKAGQGPDLGCYISTNGDVLVTNTHGAVPGNVTLISAKNKVAKTITLKDSSQEPYGCAES
jgi:YVTN family beta-propeller protein